MVGGGVVSAGQDQSALVRDRVAIIGQGMALTAAPLLAADLSRSPIAVSAVTAATYAAVLLLGLPAGALAHAPEQDIKAP